jgi:NAD(P)H dehydrogenase (quinone)
MTEERLREQLVASHVPAPYIQAMIDIENKFVDGGFDVVSGDVEWLAGRPARTFEDVLASASLQ